MLRFMQLMALFAIMVGPARAEHLDFSYPPPPDRSRLKSVPLWATQYHVHAAEAAQGGDLVDLRKRDGTTFGIGLSRSDWCNAAMEGTVAVRVGAAVRVFNADGLQADAQVDCAFIFRRTEPVVLRRLSRQVFSEVSGARAFGLGVEGYRLVPFRTVATDPGVVPTGTVLFIPGLRGKLLRLPDGSAAHHDGYVFAADKGGSITGNHVDFFTGTEASNPAPDVVTSRASKGFSALVVTDGSIGANLRSLHLEH